MKGSKIVIIILFAITNIALAQGDDTEVQPIVQISSGVYRVGEVIVDKNERKIVIEGEVNLASGLIEYLLATRGYKDHETVLVTDAEPIHLQIALILLGLEYGQNIEYEGEGEVPAGDPLEIWVEWNDGEKVRRVKGEDLVYDLIAEGVMEHTNWVFLGSQIINGVFMAELEGALISTYYAPNAIIDNPLPAGADDVNYSANSDMVPERETKVLVTIKPAVE